VTSPESFAIVNQGVNRLFDVDRSCDRSCVYARSDVARASLSDQLTKEFALHCLMLEFAQACHGWLNDRKLLAPLISFANKHCIFQEKHFDQTTFINAISIIGKTVVKAGVCDMCIMYNVRLLVRLHVCVLVCLSLVYVWLCACSFACGCASIAATSVCALRSQLVPPHKKRN
jgi:hypothetical protein